MKKIYFDTNIYNNIFDDLQYFQEVKKDIDNYKYQLYFSPVTCLEILSNSDIKKAVQMIDMIKKLNPIFLKSPTECLSYIYLNIIKQFSKHEDININFTNDFKANDNDEWYTIFNNINNINIHNIAQKANKETRETKKRQIDIEYKYATFYSILITELLSYQNITKNYLINNFFTLDIQNKFSDIVNDINNDKIDIDNNLKDFYATKFKDKCKIFNILKEDFSYIEIRSQIQYLYSDTLLIEKLKNFYVYPNIIISSILNNEDKIKYFTSNDFLIFYSKVITEMALSILSKKRHPKTTEGDFFDWDQLVYSEIADIFFTKDKNFHTAIKGTNYNNEKFIYLDSYNKYKTIN